MITVEQLANAIQSITKEDLDKTNEVLTNITELLEDVSLKKYLNEEQAEAFEGLLDDYSEETAIITLYDKLFKEKV